MAAQLILTILLDGLMALLLIVTTVYCWRLNQRIRILQDSKSELGQIIRQFDESTQRAAQSISEIHGATSRIAENIQHKIDKANYLADDLQFMIEKGNKLADKIEGNITAGRSTPPRSQPAAPARPATPPATAENNTQIARAEETAARVLAARKADNRGASARAEADAEPVMSGGDKAKASLESMLKRVAGREKAAANDAPEKPAADARRRVQGARLRSRAEQELFDALKAGGDKA